MGDCAADTTPVRVPLDARPAQYRRFGAFARRDDYCVGRQQALAPRAALTYQTAGPFGQYKLTNCSQQLARVTLVCRWAPPLHEQTVLACASSLLDLCRYTAYLV
jgi:hypothetical protein